ncbi:MAG: hypothetical protein WAM73_07685, partial [Desulfobacterales bacterium]
RTGADKNFEKLPWELGLIVFGHNVPQKISVDFQRTNSGLAKTSILKPVFRRKVNEPAGLLTIDPNIIGLLADTCRAEGKSVLRRNRQTSNRSTGKRANRQTG